MQNNIELVIIDKKVLEYFFVSIKHVFKPYHNNLII